MSSMIKIDFSEISALKARIKEDLANYVNQIIWENGTELYSRLVIRTPICTGEMVNSWKIDNRFSSGGWAFSTITNDATNDGFAYPQWVNDVPQRSDFFGAIKEESDIMKGQLRFDLDKNGLLPINSKAPVPPTAPGGTSVKSGKCLNPPK